MDLTGLFSDDVLRRIVQVSYFVFWVIIYVTILFVSYVYFCWCRWHRIFRKRFGRESVFSPSNLRRPVVPEPPSLCGRIRDGDESQSPEGSIIVSSEMCPFARITRRGSSRKTVVVSPGGFSDKRHTLSDMKALQLDMDHVFVPFSSFLWVMIMVYPCVIYLLVTGYASYRLRSFLIRQGILSTPNPDYKRAVGDLVLMVPSLVFLYRRMTKTNPIAIAEFVVESLPYFNDAAQIFEERFVVQINLSSGRLHRATIGDRVLGDMDTYVFLLFYVSTAHGVVHALANWGINPRCENAFIRRMAEVTVLYNHLGFTGARLVYNRSQNLIPGPRTYPISGKKVYIPKHISPDSVPSHPTVGKAMQEVLEANLRNGFCQHGRVKDLMKHAVLVDFVVKVRNFFLNTFEEYRHDFLAIDAEAMFAGTIIHSLDHCNVSAVVRDYGGICGVRTGSGDFECMAEMNRVTLAALVDKLPGIGFAHQYKDAPHAFYRRVYLFAQSIHKTFADRMDACIIK